MADESSGAHRDPDEIRREIARTRAEMDDTVDELGERLSPGRLVDDVWARFRRAGGLSAIGETVRDHPVPVALMGLGLAWLAIEQATGRSTAERVGPGTGRISDARERLSHAVHDKADELSERARDMKERASLRSHEMQEDASGRLDEMKARAEDASHRMADRARDGAHQAKDRFRSLLDESPLILGAIALGAGLASGLAVPATPVEDRLMGAPSDTLKGEARRMAEQTSRAAKKVAGSAVEAAAGEAKRASQDGDGRERSAVSDLKDSARRVVESAKSAAQETAREEDIGGRLSEEAREAMTRTRDAAKRSAASVRRGSGNKAGRGAT